MQREKWHEDGEMKEMDRRFIIPVNMHKMSRDKKYREEKLNTFNG